MSALCMARLHSTARKGLALLLLSGSLTLVACSSAGDKKDETLGWSASKLYAQAKEAQDDGNYNLAAKYYDIFEARYPFGTLAQQAQINAAFVKYKDGDQSAALAAVDRFIQMHPSSDIIDYAWYLKGLINFNDNLGFLGRFSGQDISERDPKAARDSYEAFKVVATRYSSSKYAEDAASRMRFIVNSLARHEVKAAKYYYRRGAFLAAINRAQHALQDYPQSPDLEEALFIMYKSYDAMGMAQLRDDTLRVLNKSYPNSAFLAGAEHASHTSDSRWWQLWSQ